MTLDSREVDGASTGSRVAAAADGVGGLSSGVDVGHEDTVSAQVQGLLHAGAVIVASDTDKALGTAGGDGTEHTAQVLSGHGAMLHVHQEPVVSKVGDLLGDGGAVGVDEEANLHVATAQVLLEGDSTFISDGHFLSVWAQQSAVSLGSNKGCTAFKGFIRLSNEGLIVARAPHAGLFH